jgi:hypothetical protein
MTTEVIERDFVDLASFVTVNTEWCQDSGVHEITLNSGRQVKTRYNIVCDQEEVLENLTSTFITNDMPKEIHPNISGPEYRCLRML